MTSSRSIIYLVHATINNIKTTNGLSQIVPNVVIDIIVNYYDIPIVCVIDNGSDILKAGFSSDYGPRVAIPNVCGTLRYQGVMVGMATKEYYIGNEAIDKRGILNLTYPVENGIVSNWNQMEAIWRQTFEEELRFNPTGNYVLLTESPLNPATNREKCVEIMFETFGVDGLCIVNDAVLALYACGKTSGIVLQSTGCGTFIVPIYKGYCLRHAVQTLDINTKDITEYMCKILMERGYAFTTFYEKMIVNDIQQKLCYFALDYDTEMMNASYTLSHYTYSDGIECDYELPDGQVITIGSERFRAPEILFKPNYIGLEDDGVHVQLLQSIFKCNVDIRNELCANVVLNGSNTMFPGLANRLKREMIGLIPDSIYMRINVIEPAPQNRKYLSWIGGAILSQVTSYTGKWIRRYEYDEYGPSIVHKKCV